MPGRGKETGARAQPVRSGCGELSNGGSGERGLALFAQRFGGNGPAQTPAFFPGFQDGGRRNQNRGCPVREGHRLSVNEEAIGQPQQYAKPIQTQHSM